MFYAYECLDCGVSFYMGDRVVAAYCPRCGRDSALRRDDEALQGFLYSEVKDFLGLDLSLGEAHDKVRQALS